ncbi:serine/threonine-protein kinase [Streptomyces rhizosphaerihabitans]|nr:serine/threonine-protein kinase [Streptomyces rhizosphaerihabitans]MCT9009107.1 serine/threonine-protein kinase [Streptomyces rhizosphaerihabitans]
MEAFEALEAGDPRQVGRYRIVARLGAGGMGRVYLGRSPGGRAVAVKLVRPELVEDGEFRRRFAREVAAARRVNGVFTAGVVDADPDGSPAWLATAYVPGIALGEAVAVHGPWAEKPVLALGAGLAEALEAIHAAGVVHRDLKPSNILLAADGPRVIDFGISVAGEASALTRTGGAVGTPGFMSPEQLTGKPVGAASDVFSLGVVLAYTATGSGPFGSGPSHALSFRVVHEEPELAPLPRLLRPLVADCLAKEPEARPLVAELLERFAVAADGDPGANHGPTGPGWLPEPVTTMVRAVTVPTQPPASGSAEETAGSAGGRPSRRRLLGIGAGVTGLVVAGWNIHDLGSSDGRARPSPGEQLWRFPVGGLVYASPAVADGTVYISSSRHLCAVDVSSGRARWKRPLAGVGLGSPVVGDGVVYLNSVDDHLYALDGATGEQRWRVFAAGAGSPAVADGIAYVGGADGHLHAVDAATGGQRWVYGADGFVSTRPVVVGAVVYAASRSGLYALDAATGDQRWSFATEGTVFGAPAVADGVVYAGSDRGKLYAVRASDGERRWKSPDAGAAFSAPAVAGGVVYAGTADGKLRAVDTDGHGRWKFSTRKNGLASPVVAGQIVYIGATDHHLYAVNADTGVSRWRFDTGAPVYSSPAVADGVAFVSTENGYLYAVAT